MVAKVTTGGHLLYDSTSMTVSYTLSHCVATNFFRLDSRYGHLRRIGKHIVLDP